MISKPTLKALLILLLCTVAYHWRILLTHDYSVVHDYEDLCLNLSWPQFWITSIREGALPLWDPYALAGHPFGGSMQTAPFYPLHLLLLLAPFNRDGIISPQFFHEWFAFSHLLAACFMFALVRELGLRRFPAVIAGICFSAGGLTGNSTWAVVVNTAIWIPLIALFLLKALRAERRQTALLYASLSGLCLGVSILAGQIHLAMMQALFVAGAAGFAAFHPQMRKDAPAGRTWVRPAAILATVAGVAFCAAAVQLFISAEFGQYAVRFLGGVPPLPPGKKIPYSYPNDSLWPQSYWGLFSRFAFTGSLGSGEVLSFYMGIFPLLAAAIGVWKNWGKPWVRYLAGLGVAAFLYAVGDFSPLYGLVRTLVPYLWVAREANRFMYLAEFALAILAAYGIEALLEAPAQPSAWRPLTRILTWVALACLAAQAVAAVFENVKIHPWVSLSLLMTLASCALCGYILRGHCGPGVRVLMVMLVVFDLTAYNWTARPKDYLQKHDLDALESALSTRGAVQFLKSRPGRFRVQFDGIRQTPPIGDLFQVRTVSGGVMAALLNDYLAPLWNSRIDLLNPRYIVRPFSATQPGDIYHDSKWRVYENPHAYPPAWVVHEPIVEPSRERLLKRLRTPEIDLRKQALLGGPAPALEPLAEGATEDIQWGACGRNNLELTARAQSRGLLVLSEIFYPGWRATVNGQPAQIYEVNGAFRGVAIPSGTSRIVMRYSPWSFRLGAVLSLGAFGGTLLAVILHWRRRRAAVPGFAV